MMDSLMWCMTQTIIVCVYIIVRQVFIEFERVHIRAGNLRNSFSPCCCKIPMNHSMEKRCSKRSKIWSKIVWNNGKNDSLNEWKERYFGQFLFFFSVMSMELLIEKHIRVSTWNFYFAWIPTTTFHSKWHCNVSKRKTKVDELKL